MTSDLVSRLREILEAPGITLRRVSEASGIPITTLADMKKPGWAKRTVSHLDAIEGVIEDLEQEVSGQAVA